MLLQQEVLSVLQRQKLHYLWWMKPMCLSVGRRFRPEYSKLDLVQNS